MPRLVRAPAIAVILAFAAFPGATCAGAPSLELKPGQALTFAATVTDGGVALGPGRLARPGRASRRTARSASAWRGRVSPPTRL